MRTLRHQPEDRRMAIARETLDIYAPLAHRLGVYAVKQELEDLSLKYLDPEGYNRIVHLVGMKRAEREENIRLVIDELSERLDQQHIHYDIDGRSKHFYSIYRKMVLQQKSFDQIYDLIAIRHRHGDLLLFHLLSSRADRVSLCKKRRKELALSALLSEDQIWSKG